MKSRGMERRGNESGFALLLVFVMAAAIAITMFIEVPRIAFESQRAREQMAIDRGLQYKRAIQLFYRKYQTFPQTLDDLETTRNIRFLRHRYLDPLTGKEWRLLHVGPAGQLTDSLVQPPAPLPGSTTGSGLNSPAQGSTPFGSSQTPSSTQTASTQPANPSNPSQPVDPNDPNAQQPPDPLNMAARRPSDRIIGGPGANPGGTPGGVPGVTVTPDGQTPQPPDPDPNQPQQPQPLPGQPVQQPGDPNQPVVPPDPSQPQFPGQPVIPGQPVAPQSPAQPPVQFPPGLNPGQTPTGTPSPQNPGFPQVPGQQGGVPFGQSPGGQQGQPGQAPPGVAPPAQSAANMIQQILTTPRQPPSSVPGFTTGSTGGIAGVASTADGKGIHVINDHTKYKEWEFYYDLKKDKTVVGAAAVNQQQQVQQQMQQNGTNSPLGSSPFNSNSPSSSPFSSGSPATPAAPAAPTTPPPTQ
jgi:hypothetical protein